MLYNTLIEVFSASTAIAMDRLGTDLVAEFVVGDGAQASFRQESSEYDQVVIITIGGAAEDQQEIFYTIKEVEFSTFKK